MGFFILVHFGSFAVIYHKLYFGSIFLIGMYPNGVFLLLNRLMENRDTAGLYLEYLLLLPIAGQVYHYVKVILILQGKYPRFGKYCLASITYHIGIRCRIHHA